jgi:sec-independent protein translocase protein TatC
MPTDQDLFAEEQHMVTMSFGDHIEELRIRLVFSLIALFVGMIITFIPPLNIGKNVMTTMEEPARQALEDFYSERYKDRVEAAQKEQAVAPALDAIVEADKFVEALKGIAPGLPLPAPESLKGKKLNFPVRYYEAGMIQNVQKGTVLPDNIISLGPLEPTIIFFTVCLVTGLVIASPVVFYQGWAFVGAGLYRHERHYVKKLLPISLGLFLSGVFLCFFFVLPLTLQFLLEFNVWLGVAPTLRLSEWMSFATILPLVFGISFQTPLVMLFLERIGVFTIDDFRSKRRFAILIIVVAAAVLTPGQDPISMGLLSIPMVLLYESGILMISRGKSRQLRPSRGT